MASALGPSHSFPQRVAWLEKNAQDFWDGEEDLVLGQVYSSISAECTLVVPGRETLEEFPETALYGVHFRKELNREFFELVGPELEAPFDVKPLEGVLAPLHSPQYETAVGRQVRSRAGDLLPYHHNLGNDEFSIRTRVVPGRSLSQLAPRNMRFADRPSDMRPPMEVGMALEGLAYYEHLQEASEVIAELNHCGIAHRDADTRNFIVTPQGVTPVDFGAAVVAAPNPSTEDVARLYRQDMQPLFKRVAELQLTTTGRIDHEFACVAVEETIRNFPEAAHLYQQLPSPVIDLEAQEPTAPAWPIEMDPGEDDLEAVIEELRAELGPAEEFSIDL